MGEKNTEMWSVLSQVQECLYFHPTALSLRETSGGEEGCKAGPYLGMVSPADAALQPPKALTLQYI